MRRIVTILCALVLCAGVSPAAADTGEPPVPLPGVPTGLTGPVPLPVEVDPVSPYLPQVSCHPVDMTGPTMLRDLLLRTYGVGRGSGISRGCNEGLSEHSEGRALDWMVNVKKPAEQAAAADFLAWVTRDGGVNARRLGIMYVIYNEKIWAVYNAQAGWRKSAGHTDHVHVSFSWNGARGATSFWTGVVGAIDYGPCVRVKGTYAQPTDVARAVPCAAPATALVRTKWGTRALGSKGAAVKRAQKLLKVKVTGRFNGSTLRAVRSYQRAHELPPTGTIDQATWASLDKSSVKRRLVTGFNRTSAAGHGAATFATMSIGPGSVGREVVILQTALGMKRADRNGWFGPFTAAAVAALEQRAGLAADGVVGADDWQALSAAVG